MTEQNIPQAGQWWEHASGIRLLAVSRDKPGWIWALFAIDKPPLPVLDQWDGWKHLPDCTGFDWVPEKPICVMCGVNPVVAGTAGCEACNQFAVESLKPMESPDDWVTQGIVPSRPEIDQWRFIDGRGRDSKWFAAQRGFCRKHDEIIDGHRYEVRCRRKDLPPKTHQVPVRLWRDKGSGQVVGTIPGDVYCVGDFAQEIKIGPDGKVFIEVSE